MLPGRAAQILAGAPPSSYQETVMSADLALDPKTTTFLFMDFQNGVLPRLGDRAGAVVQRAAAVLEAARAAGARVVFVRVAFRAGHPEVSERNAMSAAIKAMGGLLIDAPETQVVAALAPRPDEPVVVKHRVGPFAGTDLAPILRASRAETLVLLGVATSGVVLSTVRHAADEDYRLVVVEDACADVDPEVHRVLMEKVLPRQATVVQSEVVLAALGKGG
jgi:nicotinamidase-related amidase